MSYEITTAEFEEVYLADGREQRNPESVRFLWYPWAIRASALWLAGERPESITPEDRLAVSRTLSRLICDLGDEGIGIPCLSPRTPPVNFSMGCPR